MVFLQTEMERMNSENLQLKEMLNQATKNYNRMRVHLFQMMQRQQNEQTGEHSKNGVLVPRQFMDPGFGSNDEGSLSPPEGRTGRDMPPTPDKDAVGGEEQSSESKVPKLGHSPRGVDQATEATMRKARVSVRARSEAAMVSVHSRTITRLLDRKFVSWNKTRIETLIIDQKMKYSY